MDVEKIGVHQSDLIDGGYFNVGGDVRVRKGLYLGMAAGAQFTSFSSDIEVGGIGPAVEGASGTKLWAGIYPRINATYHFPRPRVVPE